MSVNHPVTKKPLGIVYCCQAFKSELLATIRSWVKITAYGLDCYRQEAEMEAESYAP